MMLSILHRATGIAMSLGLVVLAAWLVAAAAGSAEYVRFTEVMASPFGRLLLIGWSFTFFFHLMNGVRHLIWDSGRGFEIRHAIASAYFVIIAAVLVTGSFWQLVS